MQVDLSMVAQILAGKDLSVAGEPLAIKMSAEDWEKMIRMWMEEKNER